MTEEFRHSWRRHGVAFLMAALCFTSALPIEAETAVGLKSPYEISNLVRAGKYDQAIEATKQRVAAAPNNPAELRDYGDLLQTALHFTEAKAVYEEFLRRFPKDRDVGFVKESLEEVETALLTSPEEWVKALSPSDFFLLETLKFSAARWKKFPLKVYIQSAGVSPALVAAAKRACTAWQNGSGSLVSFVFVPTVAGSNIDISFTSNTNHPNLLDAQGNTTKVPDNDGYFVHAKIDILTRWHHTNDPVSPTDCFETTAHEIGHALGLGHSRDCHDVMFQGENDSPALTSNDLGMLKRLYTQSPDQLFGHIFKCLDDANLSHDYPYFKFLNEYATNLDDRKQFSKAAPKYEQVYQGISSLPGRAHDKLAMKAVDAAARCYYSAKDWANSTRCYTLYCDGLRAIGNNKELAEMLTYLAQSLDKEKRYDEEIRVLLEQAALLNKAGNTGNELADCYSSLGWVYDTTKQFPEASTYYGRASQLYKKAGNAAEAARVAKNKSGVDSWMAEGGGASRKPKPDADGYHSYQEADNWYLRNRGWLVEIRQEPKFIEVRSQLLQNYGTDDPIKIDALLECRNIKLKN